jgi:hypothetical protein
VLKDRPDRLRRIIKAFGLPPDFNLDDYCNWLPFHEHSNKVKSVQIFKPTPLLKLILSKLARQADKVREIEQRVQRNANKDTLLAKFIIALKNGQLSKEDLQSLLADPDFERDEDVQSLRDEIFLHVDPNRWKTVDVTGTIATVTDGHLGGMTPVSKVPDVSWQCPFCGNYGPWNGIRCLTC